MITVIILQQHCDIFVTPLFPGSRYANMLMLSITLSQLHRRAQGCLGCTGSLDMLDGTLATLLGYAAGAWLVC